jgi:hypothetical protein
MNADDLSLPDDMDLLKSMVRAMAQKTAALEDENAALKARSSDADERIKRLMQILKAYDRARFGRRSEKLGTGGPSEDDEAQQAFVFEEIETGISALRAQVGKGRTSSDEKRPPRARKGFPLHLERVEVVTELWKLEAEVRGQSPEARAAARQVISAPIVAGLFTLWQQTLPRISGKSKLAEALRYAISRREIFERFLTDGLIELDSNIVERAIRPHRHHEKEQPVRRFRWRRSHMGHHRHTPADLQDEQRRPRRLADPDAGAHRQPVAERRDRRSHAMELQSLNGLGFPLTIEPAIFWFANARRRSTRCGHIWLNRASWRPPAPRMSGASRSSSKGRMACCPRRCVTWLAFCWIRLPGWPRRSRALMPSCAGAWPPTTRRGG